MMFDVNQTFDKALALHQPAGLPRPSPCTGKILAVDPTHVDSLHLLGVVAYHARPQ